MINHSTLDCHVTFWTRSPAGPKWLFKTLTILSDPNPSLTGDTRKIFVSNIDDICFKYIDESHSARVLIGCKPINPSPIPNWSIFWNPNPNEK